MDEDDLYDGAFGVVSDTKDDLYDNIHDPEVVEAATAKARELEERNEKLMLRNTQLQRQVKILQNLNTKLESTNERLRPNLISMMETSRTEVNRKKNEVSEIHKQLEQIIYQHRAQGLSRMDIEDILRKARPQDDPFFELLRLPIKTSLAATRLQSGIRY